MTIWRAPATPFRVAASLSIAVVLALGIAYHAALARCQAEKTAKARRAAIEWAFSMARRRHGLS
jgi:hypothetical protein